MSQRIDTALSDLERQQLGFFGLEHDQAPLLDTPASLYGGWSLYAPCRRFWLAGYRWMPVVVPRCALLPVTPYGQVEDRVSIPPRSWLVAFAGASDQTAGFRFSIYDVGAKAFLLSDQWDNASTGAQDPTDADSQAMPLAVPALILAPGLLQVRVANLAAEDADMQLLLHFAVPPPADLSMPLEVTK